VGTTVCYLVGPAAPILDPYACHAPVSPAITDAQPATLKVSCTGAGNARAARFATTSLH
jgi:hypothetical protein